MSGTNLSLLVVALAGVSMSGPLMAAAAAVPALAMSLWRTGLGALSVAPAALTLHRHALLALPRRAVALSAFSGVMLACHFATWTSSLHLTSVASATALVSMQVAWVVVLSRIAGERIAAQVVGGLVLALVGVLTVSGIDVALSPRAATGDGLALAGGAFAAVYTMAGSRVRTLASTTTYTFLCYGTCATTLFVACLLGGVQLTGFSAHSWLLIGSVTVAAQLLGHSVLNHLLAVISPTVVSMVLLLEVPGAALIAAVFLGQIPPVAVYAGVVLICAGLALVVSAEPSDAAPAYAPVD